MEGNSEHTVRYQVHPEEDINEARRILLCVYQALKEKGYNPLNQLVGYLLSGDPAYITSHRDARSLVRQVERDELLEELVRHYLAEAGK